MTEQQWLRGPAIATRARQKVRFSSGGTECAAWFYPGTNGGCVIMTGGFAVLAFDYRCFGESGGRPRQVARIRDQLADWQAALACAASRPGVDPAKLAIWSFSASGGHVFRVAASNPGLAAAIAQAPNADGPAAARNAARFQKPLAMARFAGRGILDALGGLIGRPPRLVPLTAEPGTVALLTTPDALDGDWALSAENYPAWRREVAARSALRMGLYRPGRAAPRVRCPLLVVVCDQDRSALAEPAARAARRAPRGELVRLPGGHYAPFLGAHERAVQAELSFLGQNLLEA